MPIPAPVTIPPSIAPRLPPRDEVPFQGRPSWAVVGEHILLVRDWGEWSKDTSFTVVRVDEEEIQLRCLAFVLGVPRQFWGGLTNSVQFIVSPPPFIPVPRRTRFEREWLV